MRHCRNSERGAALVEFALSTLILLTVIVAAIEFDRLLMVYTNLSHAAGVGARYAIVHGSTRTATGDPASGRGNETNVINVVKGWAGLGSMNPTNVSVVVSYPASSAPTDPGNSPGSPVSVTVSYPYDSFTFVPIRVTLRATSRGMIVF